MTYLLKPRNNLGTSVRNEVALGVPASRGLTGTMVPIGDKAEGQGGGAASLPPPQSLCRVPSGRRRRPGGIYSSGKDEGTGNAAGVGGQSPFEPR